MSTPIPFPIFNSLLAETYGLALAGVFVSCGLFGVVALQVFLYYTGKKNKDPLVIAAMPGFLLIMEFVHQVLLCVGIYKVVINNFGNEGVAIAIFPELFIAAFFQAFCATSAHLFYTYRICMFRQGLWMVPCVTIPLTLTQFGFTFANQILTLIHRDIEYLPKIAYTVYAVHGVNVFLDVFFVVAMCILLSMENTVFSQTQTMIRRLTILIINTGLITTIATLCTIIFLGVQPATFLYAFFNFLVSPLYANSVMANLNSREYVRGRRHVNGTGAASDSVELNTWNMNNLNTTSRPVFAVPSQGSGNTKVTDGITISQDTIIRKDSQRTYPIEYKATGDF